MQGSLATNVARVSAVSSTDRVSILSSIKVSKKEGVPQSNTFVVLVVCFGAIGGILFGLDQANYGGAIVKSGFEDTFCVGSYGTNFTCNAKCHNDPDPIWQNCTIPSAWTNFQSWGGSIIQLGAAGGALLIAPSVTGYFGRRFALSFGCIFVAAAMVWSALSTGHTLFLIARALTGVAIGCITYTLPVYNSEVSPAHIRGVLGSTMQLSCVLGSQIAAGYNISSSVEWQVSLGAPCVPALILGIGIWFMPPSPRFALKKKGAAEARRVLVRLRRTENVDDELMQIEDAIKLETQEQPYSVLFTDPSIRRRVIIANMLQWLQQFTGINAMVGYGPSVFTAMGLPMDALTANFIAQGFNFIGTIIMMVVIDRMGRRPLLLAGAIVMFITMGGAGVIDKAWDVNQSTAKAWLMFVLLCIYFLGFAIAWGGVPWVYPSEIFPMDVKEKALSTSVFSQWIANFVIMQITQRLIASISLGYTFLFFAAFLLVAIFYVYLQVPETKGIALEDMDRLFGPRKYTSTAAPAHSVVTPKEDVI